MWGYLPLSAQWCTFRGEFPVTPYFHRNRYAIGWGAHFLELLRWARRSGHPDNNWNGYLGLILLMSCGLTILVSEGDGYDIVTAKQLARVELADCDVFVFDSLNGGRSHR